jgi:DMSO/TMAO reductase YedYZ molybdopterin-dependent catalytic subunit
MTYREPAADPVPGTDGPLGYRMTRGRFLVFVALAGAFTWAGLKFFEEVVGGFRINTVESPVPDFDASSYTLTVDGLVEAPMTLSWQEVSALPAVRQVSDFHCVEGWGVSDVAWEGTRFSEIVARAKPRSGATHVNFYSMGDTYTESLSMSQASVDDIMLAWGLDGKPLPKDHGAPVRVIMPRMFGYKGAKWLKRIEFTDRPLVGYWERRGWATDAWITSSGLPSDR